MPTTDTPPALVRARADLVRARAATPATQASPPIPATRRSPATTVATSGPVLAALLTVLLLAVVAITWVATRPSAVVVADTTAASAPISEDEALRRLIAKGYVPSAAIPPSLYTSDELATIRLVRAGVVPADLLQTEAMVTKGLIDRGLVPPGSVR